MVKQAQIGDVLFLNGGKTKDLVSLAVQRTIDPHAVDADRGFAHVAIVVAPLLALEASPAPGPAALADKPPVLSDMAEYGEWTESPLYAGVRLTPIADLVVPLEKAGGDLAVLRCESAGKELAAKLDWNQPAILWLLGSAYSIEQLKATAKEPGPVAAAIAEERAKQPRWRRRFGIVVGALIGWAARMSERMPLFAWASPANDMATRIGLAEIGENLARLNLELDVPDPARTYFCSKWVAKCLAIAGLCDEGLIESGVTPTGLYRLLKKDRWKDVTAEYRWERGSPYYLDGSKETHKSVYVRSLRITQEFMQAHDIKFALDLLEAGLASVRNRSRDMTDKIMRDTWNGLAPGDDGE